MTVAEAKALQCKAFQMWNKCFAIYDAAARNGLNTKATLLYMEKAYYNHRNNYILLGQQLNKMI